MKLIPLSKQGKNRGKYFAQVDDEDYDWLMKWNWSVHEICNTFYAVRVDSSSGAFIKMHRLVINVVDSKIEVDHIDHNGLNNQKHNLRQATRKQNEANTKSRKNSSSKYKGVCWYKASLKWAARIKINGKGKHIGYFNNEEEAALAYDKMAIKVHGEFANLNFKQMQLANILTITAFKEGCKN